MQQLLERRGERSRDVPGVPSQWRQLQLPPALVLAVLAAGTGDSTARWPASICYGFSVTLQMMLQMMPAGSQMWLCPVFGRCAMLWDVLGINSTAAKPNSILTMAHRLCAIAYLTQHSKGCHDLPSISNK